MAKPKQDKEFSPPYTRIADITGYSHQHVKGVMSSKDEANHIIKRVYKAYKNGVDKLEEELKEKYSTSK
jgi:predicted transcriptional regulator